MRWFVVLAIATSGGCGVGIAQEVRSPDTELTILSNNVGIFPQRIVAQYPPKLRKKKKHLVADERERARLLANALLDFERDPELILLQEIWSLPARDVLIQDLGEEYPYYAHPRTEGRSTVAGMPSGLIVFSKYPLVDDAFHEFTKGIGLDKLAQKGILGVRLTKQGRQIAVFNTHLQAGGRRDPSIKPDQLRECHEFIQEFTGGDKDVVTVLAGDFNIDSTRPKDYGNIFELLSGAHDSYQPGDSPLTRTARYNENTEKRIDYLFSFGDTEAVSTIVDPAGERISDHLAVFGRVSLK